MLFWDLENATAQFVLEMGSGLTHNNSFSPGSYLLYLLVRSVYTSPVGNMFATAGKGVRICTCAVNRIYPC